MVWLMVQANQELHGVFEKVSEGSTFGFASNVKVMGISTYLEICPMVSVIAKVTSRSFDFSQVGASSI